MGKLKQLNKGKYSTSPLDPHLMTAWNAGFNQGSKQQRESDIESLVNLLEDLEDIPGIGDKTAWKLREYFLKNFGKKEVQ